MSHLLWGGIVLSQFNTTVQVLMIVDVSDPPPVIVSFEGDTRVGSRMDGRHSRL